jgi:hypothetical protein
VLRSAYPLQVSNKKVRASLSCFTTQEELRIGISRSNRAQLIIDSIKGNVKEYPRVILNVVNTYTRRTIEEFGLSEGVCINVEPVIKRLAKWKEIRADVQDCR